MNRGALIWIILVFVAFTIAIVTGLSYAFVPSRAKERLKKFESEKKSDEVDYMDRPIVAINERFNLGVNYMSVALILFVAWILFVFRGPIEMLSSPSTKDYSLWVVIAALIGTLIIHLVIWGIFSAISLALSSMKVSMLKRRYKHHEVRVFDRTSLVFIIEKHQNRLNKLTKKGL